jgi:ribosomal protein S3
MFFHYLKYLFKYFFLSVFSELKIKGLKFKLKGKVSVAGNARTRSVTYQIGSVSHATYNNKILHSLDLVRTFTGVIGLQI